MKTTFTLIVALIYSSFLANAQQPVIQNGGFENWNSATPSYPTGWDTDDHLIYELSTGIPQKGWCTKDTTPANVVAGSASIRLRTDTVQVVNEIAPGIVTYGRLVLDVNENPYPIGLPFNGRPTVFSGNVKFQPNGADTGQYEIYLTKWDATGDSEIVVVYDNKMILNTNDAFMAFSDTLQYQSAVTPDTIIIAFSSGLINDNPIAGSIMWVDNLAFEYLSTGVMHLDADDAIKVYPNPASAALNITIDNYMIGYAFKIYDLTGRLIKSTAIESAGYTFNIADLADGPYIYAVENKEGKLINQGKFNVIK